MQEKKEGETTAIVIRDGGEMTFTETRNLGEMFAKSGYFKDAKDEAQAVVKILAGREMGVPPIAAMQGINWINDKLTLSANLMAAIVKKSGRYNYQVRAHTDRLCEIEFMEKGRTLGVSTFTMDDATKAGITGNSVWKKYPRNMLFARALSNGVRWYCPDQFGGAAVYVPEEMGAQVDGEGTMVKTIDVHPEPTIQPKVVENPHPEYVPTHEAEPPNEGPMYDTPIPFPGGIIKAGTPPRKAWEIIGEWYYIKNRRDEMVKILNATVPDIRFGYQIPESALVKMVKDITGVELEMVEEIAKCTECAELIPQPEYDTLKGICQECHDKK